MLNKNVYENIDDHINHIKDIIKDCGWIEDKLTVDDLKEIAYCLVKEGYTNFGSSYVVVKALEESFENYYPAKVVISFMDEMIKKQ